MSGIKKGRPKGYRPPKRLQDEIKRLSRTNVRSMIGWAAGHLLSIILLAGGGVWLMTTSSTLWFACAYVMVLLPLIARQQRALEVMVHDGSHYNWHRTDDPMRRARARWWNDWLTNWLAAVPVFSDVVGYRVSHLVHHMLFGSVQDPCRVRYEKLRLRELDRSSFWRLCRSVLVRLPTYFVGYYQTIGSSPRVVVRSLAWHTLIIVLPLWVFVGLSQALIYWTLFWGIPMLVSLPILRFLAEAEEHDYDRGESEFDATISNLGWIHHWLIHPWADGYHLIHHMLPHVPDPRRPELHALLMVECEIYREEGLKRTEVLGAPSS